MLDHWIARNVPAIEEASYLSSIDDYRGKLKFQLKEFGIPRQTLENSWDLVVARLRRNQNPLSIIEQNKRAEELGAQIANEIAIPNKCKTVFSGISTAGFATVTSRVLTVKCKIPPF
ncbi:MAG: hypothetical protein U5K69_02720 [Balneolaceae bacterium]|nr:hypothetical protein [Balneolaceae bacterium]